MQLFDLHWEHILVTNVLPWISIEDCFNFRCTSKIGLQIIDIYFTRLKSLKLKRKKFSHQTYKVFASTCTQLTLLDVSRSSITDDDLIPLLLRNHSLISVDLSHCDKLTAKCLQPIILHCNNLTKLKLASCLWVTTGAMEALALHQSTLTEIDLSNCQLVTESSMAILVKKFRNLKVFNIEGNRQVTDTLLFTLAKYSTRLTLLNLVGCHFVSDKGIKALGQHCKKLTGLMIRSCPYVTEESLKVLRAVDIHLDRKRPEHIPGGVEAEARRAFRAREPRRQALIRRNTTLKVERSPSGRVRVTDSELVESVDDID